MRYKVKSIAALDIILDGLPDKMRVELTEASEYRRSPLATSGS
jgi:hypothetical protein